MLQTSPTLASALYCVARHTDAQEKLCEEIARVVPPGEQITVEMINSMPYLKAFVKEVMRYIIAVVVITTTIMVIIIILLTFKYFNDKYMIYQINSEKNKYFLCFRLEIFMGNC